MGLIPMCRDCLPQSHEIKVPNNPQPLCIQLPEFLPTELLLNAVSCGPAVSPRGAVLAQTQGFFCRSDLVQPILGGAAVRCLNGC